MSNASTTARVQIRCGREDLIIETGRMAKQADASVMVQYGGTVVLVSVVVAKQPRTGVNFLPLTVEYQEKTYAAGKIPGGFFKREGRPTEKEILTCRLVDRPIRSIFPKGFVNEVQIIALVLSHDGANDPDWIAILGASAALGLSPIPLEHRVGICRVGRINGEFVLNPTFSELEQSELDLTVATTQDGILMVEAGAKEVSEDLLLEALKFGEAQAKATLQLQEELIQKVGVTKQEFPLVKADAALVDKVRQLAGSRVEEIIRSRIKKEMAGPESAALLEELVEKLSTPEKLVTAQTIQEILEEIERSVVRTSVLKDRHRMDGRDFTTVRDISVEVGILPRTHGSALFTRGQTQSLAAVTLGTGTDEQMIDSLQGKWNKSFMLHYNFPPFSVGEVRPVRGPGRREIGHGALAEKALRAVIPGKEQFPYTTRVVSEILESNGSSSMATVCSAALALMDAGVPIKSPVSGVAMGLVKEGDRHAVLTDIIGLEDHHGDMDFKVAGTQQGVTALQLDLKLPGIPLQILQEALAQAGPARAHILERMVATLPSPRAELSLYAPRITVLKIDPEKIGGLIGPGGKMIRRIIQESGATIDVEDDGTVLVASNDAASSEKAVKFIKGLTEEAELGRVYQGIVKRITNFGAFCEIAPGKEGLVHVSELSDQFVPKVEDVVKLGDTLPVKVVEIDSQGRINLSHKQALLPPGTAPVPPARRPERPGRSGGGFGRRGPSDRDNRSGGERQGESSGDMRRERPHDDRSRDRFRGPNRPVNPRGGPTGPGMGERSWDRPNR